MRVIGGTARGRRLSVFSGKEIRPTPDRVREAPFSILTSRSGGFAGMAVLDLFSGSGALGIEAISRGAFRAVFIDAAQQSIKTTSDNLEMCGFESVSTVLRCNLPTGLSNLAAHAPFDLIFMDPPYGQGLALKALDGISMANLLAEDGMACVETGADEELPEGVGTLQQVEQRRYGSVLLHFYQHAVRDIT
jgi:16S rRNA (guanine(966)-N(2))-methyltransferase RsmD